jgi:hypothetical protein
VFFQRGSTCGGAGFIRSVDQPTSLLRTGWVVAFNGLQITHLRSETLLLTLRHGHARKYAPSRDRSTLAGDGGRGA